MHDWMDDDDAEVDFGALLSEANREIAACGGQHDCPCGATGADELRPIVNADGLRPLHERLFHHAGFAWIAGAQCRVYVVDGIRCYCYAPGVAYRDHEGYTDYHAGCFAQERVHPAILRAVERLAVLDDAMRDARAAYAVAQADGDPLLQEVLRIHLRYTHGVVHESVDHDRIAFYAVGRNASHEFSLGVRNGQRYVRSFCADDGADAEHIRAVPTWDDCYLGHA